MLQLDNLWEKEGNHQAYRYVTITVPSEKHNVTLKVNNLILVQTELKWSEGKRVAVTSSSPVDKQKLSIKVLFRKTYEGATLSKTIFLKVVKIQQTSPLPAVSTHLAKKPGILLSLFGDD